MVTTLSEYITRLSQNVIVPVLGRPPLKLVNNDMLVFNVVDCSMM